MPTYNVVNGSLTLQISVVDPSKQLHEFVRCMLTIVYSASHKHPELVYWKEANKGIVVINKSDC